AQQLRAGSERRVRHDSCRKRRRYRGHADRPAVARRDRTGQRCGHGLPRLRRRPGMGGSSAGKSRLQHQGACARGGAAGTHQRRSRGATRVRYADRPRPADPPGGQDDVGRPDHSSAADAGLKILRYRAYPRHVDAPRLLAVLAGRRVAVLTGAGISTDSGIPDYRGPDSPPSNPMTIRQFTSDPVFRQRYWARHRALVALERAGIVTGVITQNVDLLHTKAGSRTVVNLHGSYAQVICLDCGHTMMRAHLASLLEAANPGFDADTDGLAVAPDADAVVADTSSFRIVDCPSCGGMLKPDIVYFGENVPKDRVAQAYSLIDNADALLVAGSSLTVFSGYRFVRHASARGIPIAIVNR